VTDEYVISGVATTALANLTGFKVRHANFDNAGYMSDTSGASGTSKYFYNLAGQVTREEDLNDATTDDGSVTRIAETDYDALNRATTKTSADIHVHGDGGGFHTHNGLYHDRPAVRPLGQCHAVSRQGTVFGSGGAISSTRTTTYDYNADNNVIAEHYAGCEYLQGRRHPLSGHR